MRGGDFRHGGAAALVRGGRAHDHQGVSNISAAGTRLAPLAGEHIRRELYVLNIYRVLQALVFLGLSLSDVLVNWMPMRAPVQARAVALLYLLFALLVLSHTRRMPRRLIGSVSACLAIDVIMALAASLVLPGAHTGIAAMLVINVGAGALLLPPRLGGLFAALAALAVVAQALLGVDDIGRNLLESGLFGTAYFATAALCYALGNQMRASEALAERRGLDLANLSQVNELIIRRMKTGVLLVDDANHIHQINESAWLLLGNPSSDRRDLGEVAPELSRRLYHWRTTHKVDSTAIALAEGVPEVVPRFTRLAANDDSHVLIFLDDTSLVSRRAEQLTLNTLGRLSASIAHEIRNPLAAIRYSAQLLAESHDLPDSDQRMVEIINNHCGRLNEIIENIL